MSRLLVIDDEPNIVYSVRECLGSESLEVLSAGTAREGIALFERERPDVVLLDVRLPDLSGLEAHERIAKIDRRVPVIMITAFASTDTAIDAMRRGAFEYLVKPVDFQVLEEVVNRALEVGRLSRTPVLRTEDPGEPGDDAADRIVGNSPAMQEVYKAIGRVAAADTTVLILGESGTGKELVARAIYHYSARGKQPFLAINCAAIPETLLESELFGHEQGAFTGANRRRIGKFEQANGGTIFLDEIGDMSLATQAKALRLLQEQTFQRVGGTETVTTDVRIIAATNQNLVARIAERRFREDLFYRLNGYTIHLPALRERREDIPLLIEHFIRRFNRQGRRTVHTITESALRICEGYDWPGNVRELEGAIRYASVQSSGDVITEDCLPDAVRGGAPAAAPSSGTRSAVVGAAVPAPPATPPEFDIAEFVRQRLAAGSDEVYHEVLGEVDRIVLREVMEHVGGKQMQACKRLGIARMTLRGKLRAIGLAGDGEEG